MFLPSRSRVHRGATLLAAMTVGLCLPPGLARAQAPVVVPAAAPPGKVVVPERTEVKLTLREELKSGSSKKDQEVPFTVAQDVYGPGRVLLIAAGTPAYGKVTESRRRGMFGKPGKLNFTCEYVQTADGTKIPLRSESQGVSGKDNQTASIATAILFAPVALFMNGRDVTVKKGQEFTMYVNDNTVIAPPYVAPDTAAATAPAPAPPTPVAAPGKTLFLLKNGKDIIGTLASFDGSVYTVSTDGGTRTIKASEIKSIHALAAK